MAERLTLEDAITHAKEVAERNRRQYKNCPSDRTDIRHQTCEECAEEHEQLATWLAELKRYKDLEEQHRLIELPCAVGDTVYVKMAEYCDIQYAEAEVRDFTHFTSCGFCIVVTSKHFDKMNIPFSEIGKTVFLTKEEAEEKLKELRGEQE